MPSRKNSNRIRFILDELTPPLIRDSWLVYALLRFVFGNQASKIRHFREVAHELTQEQFAEYYRNIRVLQQDSDNTSGCVNRILKDVRGASVCDVGCGRAHLISEIAKLPRVEKATGIDIIIDENLRRQFPMLDLREGRIENLPFEDNSYDTVVCTHTLEHIPDLAQAISELRRICRQTLIIVVPMERRYRFGFNLHVNFFTYKHVFLENMRPPSDRFTCEIVDGEIYYCEQLS
ncbi:MAG: class I SAM-dependent methyltransferase [Pseudomonadota bacterium]